MRCKLRGFGAGSLILWDILNVKYSQQFDSKSSLNIVSVTLLSFFDTDVLSLSI